VNVRNAAIITVVGGALLAVGSLLPWFELQGSTISAFDWGDGWFTLAAGLIIVALGAAIIARRPAPGWLGWVVAALAGTLIAINYRDITEDADTLGISVGIGIWVMLTGVIVALVGMFMGRKEA